MSELCLTAGDPLLCVAASQDKARQPRRQLSPARPAAGAAAECRRAPTCRCAPMAACRVTARSTAAPAGALSGNAHDRAPTTGTVTYTDRPDQPLLGYRNLALQAQLARRRPAASTCMPTSTDGGRIDGQLGISGARRHWTASSTCALNNLAFVELLTTELAAVKGTRQRQLPLRRHAGRNRPSPARHARRLRRRSAGRRAEAAATGDSGWPPAMPRCSGSTAA